MEKKIVVTVKTVYGNELNYPVCDNAKLFAALASSKTLTEANLSKVKAAGWEVIYK